MPATSANSDGKTLSFQTARRLATNVRPADNSTDRTEVLNLLHEGLATVVASVLRYHRHYLMAGSIGEKVASGEFLDHSNEEQGHAERLAERIAQLGGQPEATLDSLAGRCRVECVTDTTLDDMIRDNLVSEQTAIDRYCEMIPYLQGKDSTTLQLIKGILWIKEQRSDELLGLLKGVR